MSRKHAALQRRVARIAAEWQDPHDDKPWAKRDIVRNIDVAEDGEVKFLSNLTAHIALAAC